jgi:hypothetical protein
MREVEPEQVIENAETSTTNGVLLHKPGKFGS